MVHVSLGRSTRPCARIWNLLHKHIPMYRSRQWQTITLGQHAGQDKIGKGQGWLKWTTVACVATGTTPPVVNMTTSMRTELEWEGVQALDDYSVQYHSKNQMHTYVQKWTVVDDYKTTVYRTRMAKDRPGSTGQLWHVLQMVQCRPLSEVSLTSVLPRAITVSSLVGCESVEGGAAPDEGSPVCEETDKDRERGHVTT